MEYVYWTEIFNNTVAFYIQLCVSSLQGKGALNWDIEIMRQSQHLSTWGT